MNIDWAKRKARRLEELTKRLVDKADHPLAVVWRAEMEDISDLMKHYRWRVDANGVVLKPKTNNEQKHKRCCTSKTARPA